ncbi:MAG: hypothetical protein R2862_06370 [Thermoanaerobaculia bacterium]
MRNVKVLGGDIFAGLKLSIFAAVVAMALVAVVEALFRKDLEEILSFSLQLGFCTFIGTALVTPAFICLKPRQSGRALALAALALLFTYIAFGLLNVFKEIRGGAESPWSAFVALPVFAAFSLPVSLPIALFMGWYFHARKWDPN